MPLVCPNCTIQIPEPEKKVREKKVLTQQQKNDLQFKRLATIVKKLKLIDNQKVLQIINTSN